MGLKDDELKRLEIEERRRKYEEAERRRAELLAQNEAIKAQKAAAQSARQTKKAAEGATVNSATASSVNASDNMARVVDNYGKETPDIANMTYKQAMGFATRIVYDDERDDFLERWQKAHKDIAPTMDEMRKYLNSQKPGGVYQAAGAEYSKQIQENFKNEYDAAMTRAARERREKAEKEREENSGIKGAINKGKSLLAGAKEAVSEWMDANAEKWKEKGEAAAGWFDRKYMGEEEAPKDIKTGEWQGPKQKTPPTFREAIQDEAFMQAFLEKKAAEAEPSVEIIPWQGPQQKSIMQRALEDGEYQAFVEEQIATDGEPEEEARPVGTVDFKDNPIAAFVYAYDGKGDLLTSETQEAVNALLESSPAARAIAGLDAQGSMELYAQAQKTGDPFLLAKANKARHDYLTGGYISVLGSRLSRYLDMARGESWPEDLRDDMQGVVLQVARDAEEAHGKGEFTYDPDRETLYDAYIRYKPDAENPLIAAQNAVVALEMQKRETERLALEDARKAEQELLKQHQEEVRRGNPSQEAYDHVLLEAPQVTAASASQDETYRAMLSEIRTDRTLADGTLDSWHNRMAERYLKENGKTVDLESVEAMIYKDTLSAFEEDVLLSDMRVAKALGYDSLGAMYESWGGMDVEMLHGRAETAMREMANSITEEDVAAIETAGTYQGTGEGIGYGEVIGKGLEHGVYATTGDMLEAVWAFGTISKEDRPSAVAQTRYKYVQKYDFALAAAMYKRDMYAYADNAPSKEQGDAIRAYLDADGDPFQLGIDPTQADVVMDMANAADARADAISKWAQKSLNQKKGRVFDVSSATSGTLLMQSVATVGSFSTGSGMLGAFLGYGLPTAAQEMRMQLAFGAGRKDAALMGFAHGASDTFANMATSEKFRQKVSGFFGFGSLVNLGRKNAGDVAATKTMLGMTKAYGWAFAKSAGEQALEETVKDPMLETLYWQGIGGAVQEYIDGGNVIHSIAKGLSDVDVMDAVETTVKDAGANFISTLPLAILGGLGDGFKASRAMAGKLASSGSAEDAQAFVQALADDLENPQNRDALNQALHDAAVGQEAVVIAMTDEEAGKDIDVAAKAQEQADAHAVSETNSIAAAEAGRESALAAQERMNNGEINPELVTQVANGVEAHAKNSQSALEHGREKNQKQLEADKAFADGMKKATAKAEAEVSAREVAITNPPQEQADPAHNARVMEVNAYIEENYPGGVSDEQWQAIYDEFKADDDELSAGEETEPAAKLTKANVEFAAQIARKFGYEIAWDSNLEYGAEGKHIRGKRKIVLNPEATQGEIIKRVLVHELTHGAEGTDAYADLENALIDFKYGGDTDQFTADVNSKRNTYRNTLAREFSEQEAKAEMVADICAELISGNDEMLNRLTAERPSVARRILDAIKGVIDKLRGVRDPEMENLKRIEVMLEKALRTSGKGQGEQYSLRWSKDGKRYVEIEEDILEGVPEDRWIKTVMDTLRDRFKDGIPVGNSMIQVTRKTRKEWSGAGDTKWFRRNDKQIYADKMRAAGSADEILQASGNYVNEAPDHERKDDTADFGRGEVLLTIGGNDYAAEVLTGSKPDGTVFLYDMIRMTPTSIQKKTHRPSSRRSVPRSRDASSDSSVHDGTSVVNAQSMQNGEKYSLPSKNLLRQEVSAWRKARRAEAQREADDRKGERKFVRDTLQASRLMPAYIKDTLFNDPTSRYYERDSNDEQIIRAYQTIQQEGREAVTQRILTSRELPTKDDIAQANVLMAMAAQEGNMSTLLALSRHYAEDTTEVARALQAQKIFKRMTPIGMMQATAAQNEAMLSGWIEGHAPAREEAEANARRAEEEIADKDGRNPIALLESGEATITRENSKWGIPINERQAALIKKYKLEKVTRPGIHYNRATLKQRMLEAILATPDPLEATGGGLTLVTRLEYMKAGAPVVTNADLEYIGHQLSMYAAMDADSQEDRIGQLALARAYEANANITQAGLVEKINGGRYINMLMNATSPIRNVMGNALMTGVNAASDSVATAIDSVVSLATGTHTKANLTPKEMIEGWEAFRQETVDTFRDYFVDQAIVKQGEGRFDVNRRGRIYQTGAAETARVLESFLMSVGDRNFWKMAYVNSMNEQMRTARKNGVELDYELARAQAEKDANYATFNEDNKVRDAMNALKNAGVFGKAIDLLMPFTGVPTNIVKRQLEYGPVGLAYTSIKHAARAFTKQTFDQRAFVEEMARGLTGTGLMALGFGLKQLGMIHSGAGEEEDYQAYYMRTARGDQYTPYITVGDQNVSLSTFAPAVSPILMGAAAYDALENDVGMMTALASAMSASLDSIIDASYFSAIQDILSGDGTFTENAVQSLLTSAATQSTPSILAHVASSMDPYVRDTKDKDWMKQTLNKAKARIPGLRETLPIKYDVTGEAVANTKQGWRALLDPFTTTAAEDDPAVGELLALYERTGETRGLTGYLISSNSYKLSVTQKASKAAGTGSEGYTMELTTDQKQAINQKYADILFNGEDGIRSLIESRRWQTMSDEERVDEIADMRSNAKLEATVWAIQEYGW